MSELRASNAIAVVGAGASFEAGMPLADQLAPMVWHTLDQHLEVRSRTAAALGVLDNHGKALIGDSQGRIATAFGCIADDRAARRFFQRTFVALDESRRSAYSAAHDALARLIHSGHIEFVVALNWDTLLETAYVARYGTDLNRVTERLTKPHGDASYPESDWVLPHEHGRVPDELISKVRTFADVRPRVLLVVGYSERDEEVVERLIDPVAARWRVYRIAPSAVGEGAIRSTASVALCALADQLAPIPEIAGWTYQTFANQRGIAAAIKGERLTARDVEACPRLPQTVRARRNLDLVHYSVISGPPGCGKSITLFQVANDLRRTGREVLLLTQPVQSAESALAAAARSPCPKVLVIDDAQLVDATLVQRVKELASRDVGVLVAVTDQSASDPHHIRISNVEAVQCLTDDFLKRRDEILEIVSQLDDQVSDRYLSTRIEDRIHEASAAETPWEFTFALRGSWRTAGAELRILRDLDRADVLLLAIAVSQITQLDSAVDQGWLDGIGTLLGQDRTWVQSSFSSAKFVHFANAT